MTVLVHFSGSLKAIEGCPAVIEADGSTVSEVLADVTKKSPQAGGLLFVNGKLRRILALYLNDMRVNSLGEAVQEGDEICVLCAVAGGSIHNLLRLE